MCSYFQRKQPLVIGLQAKEIPQCHWISCSSKQGMSHLICQWTELFSIIFFLVFIFLFVLWVIWKCVWVLTIFRFQQTLFLKTRISGSDIWRWPMCLCIKQVWPSSFLKVSAVKVWKSLFLYVANTVRGVHCASWSSGIFSFQGCVFLELHWILYPKKHHRWFILHLCFDSLHFLMYFLKSS